MTTDANPAPITFSLPGSTRVLSALRRTLRTRPAGDGIRDAARELPGFPTAHRGAFTVALLADSRPAA
ncbi:hypothetical protein [Cellulomonas sp. ATA003]|uniref:hypothetical protein n=1 Tax=Cellulomonas sp. ATA003 TaxID=3073064 RepID=UPI002872B2FE|nr:hypothetical protein [Cellulomonas sp. ATA003]WNB84665.1 hypothetical protein REH70_12815 [Cellulomonas sp. ATA003]